MKYETETCHGRTFIVRHIFKFDELKVDTKWAPADGSDYEVTITNIDQTTKSVFYTDGKNSWVRDHFNFQCRYCLMVES